MNHALPRISFLFDPRELGTHGPQAARATHRHVRTAIISFFVTYVLLLWMSGAHAEGEGLFGSIVADTTEQTEGWLSGLATAGKNTFLTLAAIEITWCAILWAFEKDSMNGIMGDLVKSIMTIGFFYMVLLKAPEWIPAIHQQFVHLSGSELGTVTVTPDGIIGEGIRVAAFVWINLVNPVNIFAGMAQQFVVLITAIVGMIGSLGLTTATSGGAGLVEPLTQIGMILLWGFGSWAIAGLVSLVVLICYAIIAIQLILLQIEMGLLMAAGAVLLGLGGSRWTRDYVQKYLNHALVTGIRFLVLMMVMQLTMAGLGSTPWEATATISRTWPQASRAPRTRTATRTAPWWWRCPAWA